MERFGIRQRPMGAVKDVRLGVKDTWAAPPKKSMLEKRFSIALGLVSLEGFARAFGYWGTVINVSADGRRQGFKVFSS